eukprot:gene5096-10194_t
MRFANKSATEAIVEVKKLKEKSSFPQSCNEAVSSPGILTIQPDSQGGPTYDVYCDLTTPGGPWMLIWSYLHIGGDDNALVEGIIPTSPSSGYSHVMMTHFKDASGGNNIFSIDKIRFYCETTSHSRKIHFYTSNSMIKQVTLNGLKTSNIPSHWNTGFTTFSDHNAFLPATANNARNNYNNTNDNSNNSSESQQFHDHPFFTNESYHWNIRSTSTGHSRYECDDYANDSSQTTLHQIWVAVSPAVSLPQHRQLIESQQQGTASCWTYTPNTDRGGSDLTSYSSITVDQCKTYCIANPLCTFMVYAPLTIFCWLKNNAGSASPANNRDLYDLVACTPSTVPTSTPSTSALPSTSPSTLPSTSPSNKPTNLPTTLPSTVPSISPSSSPSISPTTLPSTVPSIIPSTMPSILPTDEPTHLPSTSPTAEPSTSPTSEPS